MKLTPTLCFFTSLVALYLNAQDVEKNIYHYIENPQVISEHKEDPHAGFYSFSDEKSAQENDVKKMGIICPWMGCGNSIGYESHRKGNMTHT